MQLTMKSIVFWNYDITDKVWLVWEETMHGAPDRQPFITKANHTAEPSPSPMPNSASPP